VIAIASKLMGIIDSVDEINHATSARVLLPTQALTLNAISYIGRL
jgi:hypothetical protein